MMNEKNVKLEDVFPIIAEKLSSGGEVTFGPKGTSMLPLIVQGKDRVTLTAAHGRLKKYDLPLYRRENGQFVLHRVVAVNKDGTYTMCGDNQYIREYGITDSRIIGVVKIINHGGEEISVSDIRYKCYCRFIVAYRRLRRMASVIKHRIIK